MDVGGGARRAPRSEPPGRSPHGEQVSSPFGPSKIERGELDYHGPTLAPGRPYLEANTLQRARLTALVARLGDDELRSAVNEHWTVAGVLGHIAFWDARVLALAGKLESGVPFSPSDAEPEDVDWINDATRPLIHAIEPRVLTDLALRLAEETDRKVATLPPPRMWPDDPESPINPLRATHRGEHLDQIEAVLRG
jgi:hypothetical protein